MVQYGNRRLLRLKADYQEYDDSKNSVKLKIDGKLQNFDFGCCIEDDKSF